MGMEPAARSAEPENTERVRGGVYWFLGGPGLVPGPCSARSTALCKYLWEPEIELVSPFNRVLPWGFRMGF